MKNSPPIYSPMSKAPTGNWSAERKEELTYASWLNRVDNNPVQENTARMIKARDQRPNPPAVNPNGRNQETPPVSRTLIQRTNRGSPLCLMKAEAKQVLPLRIAAKVKPLAI